MTNDQIQIIVDSIKTNVPEMKTAIYLAKIDDDGRVLKRDVNQNEYTFAGIHDRDDGYFYIRLRNDGKIQFSETSTSKKFASIQNFYRMRYNLRVVACLRNSDPVCFEEKIRFAIMNAGLVSNSSFANVSIEPIESTIDPMTVVSEESPKGVVKPFDKNLTFIAFDFDLIGDRDMSLEYYCLNPCSTPSC